MIIVFFCCYYNNDNEVSDDYTDNGNDVDDFDEHNLIQENETVAALFNFDEISIISWIFLFENAMEIDFCNCNIYWIFIEYLLLTKNLK